MFDISIGTLIPAPQALKIIPILNEKGFESYELDFAGFDPLSFDYDAYAEQLDKVLCGRKVSAVGFYTNCIEKPEDADRIAALAKNIGKLGCNVIGTFAGGDGKKSVKKNIEDFKRIWEPVAAVAEDNGVKIGFEGCGGGWHRGSWNIAFCSDAWELMFDAIPSPALGLEWEPCHAMEHLADPITQLRNWARRVVHVHGKDGSIAWDVIRDHGVDSPVPYMWNRTPGFGDNNWADIFSILIYNGFKGACDIEGYHDMVHYDDMEWTAQVTALDYLKRCRGGVEHFEGPEYRGYQGDRSKRVLWFE